MPNALQHETSPYLLQHADNPVDWLPWDSAALERARKEQKPILLSIGYSACHWCHVMAHESFEDEATAALMNQLFVNIKVDREERPDIDRIYQTSQQLFTGRPGGWPLTMFLTPDEQWPIFAGTYFPKNASYGMPSFSDVLQRVSDYFHNQRDEVDSNAARLLEALERSLTTAAGDLDPGPGYLKSARARLGETFDAANGGFGQAPKFPHSAELGLLLSLAAQDSGARQMVETSLNAMISGGLFDHLAGGFFRYCVDADWQIPHFEKMLYDNAALLGLLSDAAATLQDPRLAAAANATADWLLDEMRDPAGAFYSTLDADSDGEEGLYYSFTPTDFEAVLDEREKAAATAHFGLDRLANFEGRAWHLQPRENLVAFGSADEPIEGARAKLLEFRRTRTAPGRDEKILTSWNGLLIGSLARAARQLSRHELGVAATEAVDFLRRELWSEGRLKAVYKDGQARFSAYLDDHAFLAHGLLELMQWQFRPADLEFAIELADCMQQHFADPQGGFFFTSDDHERLIHRPKPLADESVPSGNGLAAIAFDSLGHLLGRPEYLEAAAGTVRSAMGSIAHYPEAHASLLRVMARLQSPPRLLIVRGSETELQSWGRRIDQVPEPDRLQFLISDQHTGLPGLLESRSAAAETRAYLCTGTECQAPIDDIDELVGALQQPPA